ncbi:PD-(D/E)XK motif protein [Agrobacterium salinitolerans]|uniref:PD-(D/E)XK motif protein n=1 Tax=Agrobacterium salinitolerans TaxID=1183413 RepID=UPI0020B31DF5|nr:PD-(D/E)XK motif protein [Agrobacterium salinitolerans]
MPDSSAARSLNALVEAVHDLLDSAEAVESFDAKLSSHGYAPLPEYDDLLFVVSEIRTYRVEDGFPKLVRSEMPEAVGRVSYDIRLESIESYLCNSESVFGGDDGTDCGGVFTISGRRCWRMPRRQVPISLKRLWMRHLMS